MLHYFTTDAISAKDRISLDRLPVYRSVFDSNKGDGTFLAVKPGKDVRVFPLDKP